MSRHLFAAGLVALVLCWAPGFDGSWAFGVAAAVAQVQVADDSAEPVDPEKERAALRFLGDQFPELADLVSRLKEADPAEYADAIKELYATYERLERLRTTDRRNYLRELKDWQLRSRIDVVVARLTVAPNPYLEKRLRDLVAERIEARRLWLLSEQQSHQRRADELGAEAKKILDRQEELVDNALGQLLREVEQARQTEAAKENPPGKRQPADNSKSNSDDSDPPPTDTPTKPTPSANR